MSKRERIIADSQTLNTMAKNDAPPNDQGIVEDFTLVLLCKKPALYHGKQRLAATMGPVEALNFAEHFLACALEDLNHFPGNIVISPSSVEDEHWAGQQLDRPTFILAQQQGNLGQRLNNLDRRLRESGHVNILYIGSDAPILAAKDYRQITAALTDTDIALAPSSDGGVTIMANRKPWPDMAQLPWSSDKLGDALARLCTENQLSVGVTEQNYDIDHESQLYQLALDLVDDQRPARQALLNQIQLFTAHSSHKNETQNYA